MSEGSKIIIAVDDEISMKELFQWRLKNEIRSGKIDFQFFEGAQACLNFIDEKERYVRVILLFSDINMPEMNGLSLLEVIKNKYPSIRVYMASAYDTEDYQSKAKSLGAEGYLVKPIDFDQVRKIIESVI